MSTAITRFTVSSVPASVTGRIQQFARMAGTSLQEPTLRWRTATLAELNADIARKICQTGQCASPCSLPGQRGKLSFLSTDGSRTYEFPVRLVSASTVRSSVTATGEGSTPAASEETASGAEENTVTFTLEMTPRQLKEAFKSTANPGDKPTWGPYADDEQTAASTGELPSEEEMPLASASIASA